MIGHFVKYPRKINYYREKAGGKTKDSGRDLILQPKWKAVKSTTQFPGDTGNLRLSSELLPGPTGPGTSQILPEGLCGPTARRTSPHLLLSCCTRHRPSVTPASQLHCPFVALVGGLSVESRAVLGALGEASLS